MKPASLLVLCLSLTGLLHAEAGRDAALALYKSKHYPEARDAFARIAAADPRNAEAHYYLGVLALRRNDTDEAVSQLETATTLDPKNSAYFADLGDAYGDAASHAGMFSKLGLARKCEAALEKAVELDPNNLGARDGLISYYRAAPTFAGGGMDKAYEQAREIRKRDPLMGANALGQLYADDKKYDEAFGVLEDALKAAPNSYAVLYAIGRTAALADQRVEQGEQALRRCLDLTPGRNQPSHAAVHWRLGCLAEQRHDPAAARTEYQAALRLDPSFAQAKASLAKLP